jgi:H+/Cl- antiporter ClcA/CBS domain-containing protein
MLVLAGMALIVGGAGSGSAWLLLKLIALITNLLWFGRIAFVPSPIVEAHAGLRTLFIPAAGSLIIGLMARYGSEKIRGHGIPEAIEAILFGQSRMSPKVAVLKPLSSAISIGSGGPFGAEGPIIMTGGAFGSLFAQFFHLSAAERKTLLVAGAAAGMTAIFATPVAAVLLAVELLLFEWKPRSFVPVAAAVATSSLLRPILFGAGPLFPFVSGALPQWALVAAVGVGLATGLLSAALTKLLYLLEDAFEHLPIHWMWWPALGGLFVGLGGLIEPRALGVGYDVIQDLLTRHMLLSAVLLVLSVKALVWLVALGSGTSGGVLAPLLILGGGLGWLIGTLLPGQPGTWALLGMAAMLGGTMRSPLTGAIFAVELTGDFGLLGHLLAASTAAYMVTVLLLRRSILTEKIARRGQHISREYAIDPYTLTRVGDVMIRNVDTLRADQDIASAVAAIESGRRRTYPVVSRANRPVGLVSRGDALRWRVEGGHKGETLGEHISDASVATVHADDMVSRAVNIMLATDQGRLPVIDRETGALVGLLTRRDVLAVQAQTIEAEMKREAHFAGAARPRLART